MASNEHQSVNPSCTLCGKLYNEPLMLYCLHSFCKKCLLKSIDKEGITDQKVRCPTCHKQSRLPSEGPECFPSNLRLNHLAEVTGYQKKMEKKVSCERCTNSAAITFCANCCLFMCESCVQDHQRWRELKNHEVIQLEQVKKKGDKSLRIEHPPQICPEHPREELRFYCLDDQVLVCRDCLVTTHNGHKREYLEKVAESEREDLKEIAPNLYEAIGKLDEAIRNGKAMQEAVKASQKEAANKIDAVSKELIRAIQARQGILHERCKAITSGKDDVLSNQIDQFEKLKEVILFLNDQVDDAIKNHSPEELLSVKKFVKQQVQKVMDDFGRFLLGLQESQSLGTSLDTTSLLDQIASLGFFPSVPEPDYCSIEGVAIPEAILGKERHFKIVLKDEKDKPLQEEALFQYKLVNKSDEDAPLPQVTITQAEARDGTATLSITPPTIGEYELTVMVRNVPLKGCPFRMWVHPPRDYSNLPNPTELAIDSSQCRGIAVDPVTGKVYATDYDKHTVIVLKPDGTRDQQIGSNENAGGTLINPWGVALCEDQLYVVSNGSCQVKIYAMSGEPVGEFGEKGNGEGQFSNPVGIVSDNKGHLLVADFDNKRIQVWSTKGEYIRSIPCGNNPRDIAIDVDGNIHVAVCGSAIQIYNGNGEPGATYRAGGNLTGIAINSEGYKMVTDASSSYLRVIDPDGKEITTLQNLVWGVAMDSQGYIYAGCSNKAAIHKF